MENEKAKHCKSKRLESFNRLENETKPGSREKEPTGIRGLIEALERPLRETQMANREALGEKDELEMDRD